MAYVDQKLSDGRNKAVIGVIAIHAAIGYVLVSGMAVDFVETIIQPNPEAVIITPKPVEPPPVPEVSTPPEHSVSPPIFTPRPPITIQPAPPLVDTTDLVLPPLPDIIPTATPGLVPRPDPTPRMKPAFDPVSALPRNNPGSWVTTQDYRSSWINRELTGTTGFTLKIGTSGRVESCLVTRSSGHDVLDAATCDLVTRRARFDPARDDAGNKTSGTFTNSVRWQLPD